VNSSPRKTVNSSQWIRHQKVKSSQWACHSVFKHYNNFVAFKYFTIWTYLPINIPAVNFFSPSRPTLTADCRLYIVILSYLFGAVLSRYLVT